MCTIVTNGYTTLAAIKAHKIISSTNTADDGVIDALIHAASRYIDNLTGRRFYTTTADETRYFSTTYGGRLQVWDLLAVTSLKTDEDGDRTYETTWATTDYDLFPLNAALDGIPYTWIEITPQGNNTFPRHNRSIQIVGTFGYSTTTPADIEIACRLIVLRMYQQRFGITADGPATITGAGVVITPNNIPTEALKIINAYKRFS